jgi:hypothetical protein
MRRTRLANDLQALQRFFEEFNKREDAATEARLKGADEWEHAVTDLANFMEIYACAYNNGLVVGRGARDLVRNALIDAYNVLRDGEESHTYLADLVQKIRGDRKDDRNTVYAELRKLIRGHAKEVEQRRANMARLIRPPGHPNNIRSAIPSSAPRLPAA